MQALEDAIRPNTRLILTETPTNPYLRVVDLPRLAELAQRHGLLTLIDATFGTPYNIRPLALGIDLVIHSATKYLGGHNDLLAGVVIGRAERSCERCASSTTWWAPSRDPQTLYLLLRGLKTLEPAHGAPQRERPARGRVPGGAPRGAPRLVSRPGLAPRP